VVLLEDKHRRKSDLPLHNGNILQNLSYAERKGMLIFFGGVVVGIKLRAT
jgi:hypothetical protein